ncbi:MAG: lipopolysaccharide transport periplasmic protein LptA [Gammaproteobacteria bacterium]|nr:lipopolysaccharide transport periplasmic protein LptA [Gammaproteobacteria bacterium]
MKWLTSVSILSLLFIPCSLVALTGDRDQPINIEADKLEIDENRQISIYQGNVRMQQGSLSIQADKIILHFDAQNDLEWLEINGNPAQFNQLNDERKPVSGTAQSMHYYDRESLLKLMGRARFKSDKDSIESENITVNTATNALQAGDQDGSERVRMLIQPKQP